ncbi:hypothetical protein RHECIAT_CH0001197 [Rhizobium etli CIAT 652]|uniref:Uncharacterized protein n=1 Tax=Rhizobium etli (strain CIAT 652) TaxID=491916 RepID=B3PT12_RHIE6|nr:hypothetical protein RHECIAT_CH0001197 [Rhizobium etli CIAT 652]
MAFDGVVVPCHGTWRRMADGANSRGHAQSSGAATWRMEEFALADSYDRAGPIYKLNIDHVCIADL